MKKPDAGESREILHNTYLDKKQQEKTGMSRIKICGLRRPEDIEAVNAAKPDYCGFIVECPKSRRSIDRETLRELVRGLQKEIVPVGVFVNAPKELVAELLEEGTIQMAQLHGQESQEYIRELKKMTEKPLIQAFSVKTREDVERARESAADYILLDQGSGGTGKSFDWSLVGEVGRPYFLAGGLGVENLREAIGMLHPWAVDLSSSLEIDGSKDAGRIRQAVEIVRMEETKDVKR